MFIFFFFLYFYHLKQDGQIQYDDSLTETPIGTIIYAIDDESSETDPSETNHNKNFQLQDVVTHGNINDKSFINHNLFTIGDGNDANIESDSDEDDDDDMDDIVDIDKQTANSKFSNFAFSSDKPIRPNEKHTKLMTTNINKNDENRQQNHLHAIQSNTNVTNGKLNHERHQGQINATDNGIATHLPNGQMTYKQLSKYKHTNKKHFFCQIEIVHSIDAVELIEKLKKKIRKSIEYI